jgi:hypothetical protein
MAAGPRMPVLEHVGSVGCYAAGCLGVAGDTSCELRPWSTSGARSNPFGPDDRPQLRVDADLAEDGRVAERLADRTPQIGGEVDDSFGAVIEDQAELVAVKGLDGGYGHHATDARPAG